MYIKLEGGSEVDIQGLKCQLPPVGHVFNILTKKVEFRGVYKTSDKKEEQYWRRIPMPVWYKDVMKAWDEFDKKKKDDEPEFYDERLEGYKKQEYDIDAMDFDKYEQTLQGTSLLRKDLRNMEDDFMDIEEDYCRYTLGCLIYHQLQYRNPLVAQFEV